MRYLLVLTLLPFAASAGGFSPVKKPGKVAIAKNLRTKADLYVVGVGRRKSDPPGCLGRANVAYVVVGNRGGSRAAPAEVVLQIKAGTKKRRWFAHTAKLRIPALGPGATKGLVFERVNLPAKADHASAIVVIKPSNPGAEGNKANNRHTEALGDLRRQSTCGAARAGVRTLGEKPDLLIDRMTARAEVKRNGRHCLPTIRIDVRNRADAPAGRPTVKVTMKQIGGKKPGPTWRAETRAATQIGRGEKRSLQVTFDRHELRRGLEDSKTVLNAIRFEVKGQVIADRGTRESDSSNNHFTLKTSIDNLLRVENGVGSSVSNISANCR